MSVEARGATVAVFDAARADDEAIDEGQLGMFLLRCLVDEVEILRNDDGGDHGTLRLVKRRGA